MKKVRFSEVVGKSGKPEIYLLLDKQDPVFRKAVKEQRIMSIIAGSGADYGKVGYEPEKRGQILLFPRSLKTFVGSHIVGIRYELFSEISKKSANAFRKQQKTKQKPCRSPERKPRRRGNCQKRSSHSRQQPQMNGR